VTEKRNLWLPIVLMLAFAATRFPGVLPPSFSAAYALIFCAGVYLPRQWWWLPFATLLTTDIALNVYYAAHYGIDSFKLTQLANYGAYALAFILGQWLGPRTSFSRLLGGGILSAFLFYVVTNTIAWLVNPFGNPEYTRTLMGWLTALTKGTAGYMAAWEFFRNTLLSGGIFTALFVSTMKLTADAESPLDKDALAPARGEHPEEEAVPEEAKA
jgi:hypothetical protein